MRMQDKVVVVTGGARGIGKATVLKFASEGASVAFCDLNKELGEELLKEIGEKHSFAAVNVADREDVQKWIDSLIERYDHIDAFINNAGITRDNFLVKVKEGELVKQMPVEDFDTVISVNLKGVFNCTQAVAPYMIKRKSGVILNTSSIVGTYGNLGQTNYVASKSGVVGMTKVWAREFGRYGVRVNAISPGFVETEMVKAMPEKIIDRIKKQIPLGRLGTPEEIANVYLWLASDEASFISGANVSADGAMVLGT